MDKTIGISELRKTIASKVKEVHEKGSRYIIVQRSQSKAMLLSAEEVESLEIMADRDILEDIRQAKEDIAQGKYDSYEKYFGEELPDRKK